MSYESQCRIFDKQTAAIEAEAKIAKLEEAALNAQGVLEEAVNADILLSGTTIRDEAVTAIILLGEAIEAIEVQA